MAFHPSRPGSALLSGLLLASLASLSSGCATVPHASARKLAVAPSEPIGWIELGPQSAVLARIITGADDCPKLRLDAGANELPTTLRAAPNEAFPVRVCEATLPAGTRSALLGAQELPVPSADPRKILFIGDTGCRVQVRDNGTAEAQSCNDPKAWPFPQMARNEAGADPELVVHLGDFLYRESPCPAGNAGCAGSPSGNNWESWNADFFDAALPLLRKAPWVFARGNHELCKRAGEGWFRFLDPAPYRACTDDTAPYLVRQGRVELVVLDSALATDLKAPDDQVRMYRRQLQSIASLPLHHAWLVTHKPFWAPAFRDRRDPQSPLESFNLTLQTASQNRLPEGIDTVFAGHLHLFEELHFADGRPTQIVAGNGGTSLSPVTVPDPRGLPIAGTTISSGMTFGNFGYFTLESQGSGWRGTAYDGDGRAQLDCRESPPGFRCQPSGAKHGR